MACSLTTVQENYCESSIGKLDDEIMLLRVIAQNLAGALQAFDPTADISPEAILERACESGIGRLDDEVMLLKVITQNLCSSIT